MKSIILISLVSIMALACNRPTNYIEVSTNYGDFVLELYDETPQHRDNFQKLVKDGFYNNLLFHRVISEFMIQGGDPESLNAKEGARLGQGGPGYRIPAEIGKSDRCYHKRGALAAAREGDQTNPERESSGSQFYIVVGRQFQKSELTQMERNKVNQARQRYFNMEAMQMMDSIDALRAEGKNHEIQQLQQDILAMVDAKIDSERELYEMTDEQKNTYIKQGGTPHLDGAYTVFGEIVSGMDVVERISNTETNGADRPKEDVVMKMKFVRKP